ncbi:hypothetical protein NVS55_40275 (plasmid) [Myxococcus stipitatus]|uniref:hypothetical protein n=1 Tax=Myxococcus stipitatus TaxID=83455 RepID=UPI0031451B3F
MSTEVDPKPLNSSPFIAAVEQLIPHVVEQILAAEARGAHPDRIAELRQLLHCLRLEEVAAALSGPSVAELDIHIRPRDAD